MRERENVPFAERCVRVQGDETSRRLLLRRNNLFRYRTHPSFFIFTVIFTAQLRIYTVPVVDERHLAQKRRWPGRHFEFPRWAKFPRSHYATSRSELSVSCSSFCCCCLLRLKRSPTITVAAAPPSSARWRCSSCSFRRRSCSSRFCFRHLARRFLNHTWNKHHPTGRLN